MAIVARATRSVVALALSAVMAACSPAPSGVPRGSASSPTQGAAASLPACPSGSPTPATRPWWQTAVFYEVFVRSFADSNGDGIGDLEGLRAHLDELNDGDPATTDDLGVTALWLMPIATSPSYHGYDVVDYTAVEPDYGDAEAFRRLVEDAHARGIKVVLDFEANHSSNQNPWFIDALAGGPHRDWYIWSPTDPGWPNPIGSGNPWHASSGGFYYGLFSDAMPDLNLRNPAVTAALEQATAFWTGLGADGFRIDAARHLIEDGPEAQLNTPETRAWLAGFRDAVHGQRADELVLGEVDDAELTSGSYITDGSLDMTFDFEIGPAIANAVTHGDAGSLLYSEGSIQKAYSGGGAGTFLSNHDQPRIMTQLRADASAMATSAGTLLTAPGTPFVYYGEELGMVGDKPDEQIRTPYPWTAADPGHGFTDGTPWEPFAAGADTANPAAEAGDPTSFLSTYRDLIRLRTAHPALATAPVLALEASSPRVAASLRVEKNGERLIVIQNLGTDAAPDVSLGLRNGPFCAPLTKASAIYPAALAATAIPAPVVDGSGGFSDYRPLATIPGRSTTVISLSP